MSKNPGEPHTTGDVKSINYGDCSEPDSGSCSDTSSPWKNVIGYVGESGHYEVRYQIANVGRTNSRTVVCPEIEKNTV